MSYFQFWENFYSAHFSLEDYCLLYICKYYNVFLLHMKLKKLFSSILKNVNQIPQFTQELRRCIIQCLRTS